MSTYFVLEQDYKFVKSDRDFAYLNESFGLESLKELSSKLLNCEPIATDQFHLILHIPGKRKPGDYLYSPSSLPIFSERLVNLVTEMHAYFNAIPVEVVQGKNMEVATTRYYLINLLEKAKFVNPKQSKMKLKKIGDDRQIILSHQGVASGITMGRDVEFLELVLVRYDLVEAIQRAKISGCLFEPCQNPE